MTDAKIIALFEALEIADMIMNVLNNPIGWEKADDFEDIDCSFHGLETSDEETDEEKTVFALAIRVEAKK